MSYLDRAKLLGHDIERLKRGEVIESTVLVKSIDEFKAIFAGNLSNDQRAAYSRQVASSPATGMDATMQRLMNYVYGNAALSPADADFASKKFPLKINAVSGTNISYTTNTLIGPAAPPKR